MPTITLNRKVFEKSIGKKLPIDRLKDRISMLGTDLEQLDENSIVTEVFPNRPDMLSMQGFVRAFNSFIGYETGLKHYKVEKSGEQVIIDKSVKAVRPYTACAIVKNLKFDSEKIKEIIDIQEKLHITYGRNRKKAAIGIYPFEKIKTPITFLAQNPKDIVFQPLEFSNKMTALEIIKEHPAGKVYGHLLAGLKKFPVFRDANSQVLSLPPIINSHNTGKITPSTEELFIECSGFDFNILKKCLNMIVTSLSDIGGKIYSMELVDGKSKLLVPDLKPEEMDININYINKLLGLDLKEDEIKRLLERMGFGFLNKKVLIPSYRTDILHQVDLAEDVAIAYGFENFRSVIPNFSTVSEENKFEIFKNKVSELLLGLGFIEVSTYNLTNIHFQNQTMETTINLIELKNAMSMEYNALRAWILPSLMEVLSRNKHNEYPHRIFAIGKTFIKNEKCETGIEEKDALSIAIASEKTDYTEIRQIIESLLNNLGLKYNVSEYEHDSFIQGRVAEIKINNMKVAFLGEISPKVIRNWDLSIPISALELDLSRMWAIYNIKKTSNQLYG